LRLKKIVDDFSTVTQTDFMSMVKEHGNHEPKIQALLDIVEKLISSDENAEMTKEDQIDWFVNKPDLFVEKVDELVLVQVRDKANDGKVKQSSEVSENVKQELSNFIQKYNSQDDYSGNPVTRLLYLFLLELYRKFNIPKTMESTFAQIQEIKERIDGGEFMIKLYEEQIKRYNEDIVNDKNHYEALSDGRFKLSRKIEEAEISYMRTEQIYDLVMKYADNVQKKLKVVVQRQNCLLGDTILMAASVTMLGNFSPEERDLLRVEMARYFRERANKIETQTLWEPEVYSSKAKKRISPFA
jgi:hypothetical protein